MKWKQGISVNIVTNLMGMKGMGGSALQTPRALQPAAGLGARYRSQTYDLVGRRERLRFILEKCYGQVW